jgi:uncharacterized SAM-dependent methyltransferase
MGFDLKKDLSTLLKAYNDSGGVTAAFNLNLFRRINNELEANFDLDCFTHYATYNPNIGAIESFVLSTKAQQVTIGALDDTFSFEAWEPIHLEYSYKFNKPDIKRLARQFDFAVKAFYPDERDYFVDVLWERQ